MELISALSSVRNILIHMNSKCVSLFRLSFDLEIYSMCLFFLQIENNFIITTIYKTDKKNQNRIKVNKILAIKP